MKTFDQLGLSKTILEGLEDIHFEKTFPIQEAAIPVLLEEHDVIGQAHTGTGKTGAYALPMLQKVVPKRGIQGLVLAPTRELAIQITTEIKKFAKYTGIKTATIYGGQGMGIQLDALKRGVEVLVATPGRLIDHLKRGSITFDDLVYVSLDEADVMLDMGFIEDIQFILDMAPEKRTTSLFSATMPVEIIRLSEQYLKSPKKLLIDSDDLSGEGIDQSFLVIRDREKSKYLIDFIKDNKNGQTIVFCSTKHRTRDVARNLNFNGFRTVAIEGDMSQHRREEAMSKFRKGKVDVLVATDVAARGIDVPHVALVINYDVPNQDMIYFHRIGRTARAGGLGRAITLVSYSSVGDFNLIKKQTHVKMTDLNQKLGIEVNIPDPLKRQVSGPRHYGGYGGSRSNRSNYRSGSRGGSRSSYRGNSRSDRSHRGDSRKKYYGLKSRW